MRRLVLIVLAVLVLAGPAEAGLQYFGYALGASTDRGLEDTSSFTNVTTVAANDNVYDSHLRTRVAAAAQRGLKSVLGLGLVLWCPDSDGVYRNLCADWRQRLDAWVQTNGSILSSSYVLGFTVRDEPFGVIASMSQYEAAAAEVKSRFPWARIILIEAACVVRGFCETLGYFPQFDQYQGNLPNTDWVGLDEYGIRPLTDSGYQQALQKLKNRFPGRPLVYVMDAQWDPGIHDARFGKDNFGIMETVAREWYQLASSDPDAVVLAGFLWCDPRIVVGKEGRCGADQQEMIPPTGTRRGAEELPCPVLVEHRRIGRAITGRIPPQTAYPKGYVDGIDSSGVISGWACDPDGAICESVDLRFYVHGWSASVVATTGWGSEKTVHDQCSTGKAHRFRVQLPGSSAGRRVAAYALDLSYGSSLLPAYACEANPSCVWYPNHYQPKGLLDGISSSGYATGWACDPDAPEASIQVKFIANGSSAGTYRADVSNEYAVTAECGGGTAHRFGVQLPSWTKGLPVYAYGIDTMSGESLLPGWSCPQDPACVW